MIKPILGRYDFDFDNSGGGLSKEKIKLLQKIGITRADLSNYKHGRLKHISKKHLKIIETMSSALLLSSKQFTPFAANKQKKNEVYLVQRGIKV